MSAAPRHDGAQPVPADDALGGTEPLERPRGMVDEAAEVAVLAAVLTDQESYFDVCGLLDDEDFADAGHREVWRAVRACESQGRPVDVLTVADELKRSGVLGRVGGMVRLEDLARAAGRLDHVVDHARIVAERALARRVAHASREIAQVALDPRTPGDDALAFAEQSVFDIGRSRSQSSLVPLSDAVPDTLKELAQARTSALVGHSTGFRDLDRVTGGFQGGQLLVLAARPGMGKSALALALAANIAEGSGRTVAFFSYEMSVHELTTRLLASTLGCELQHLRQGRIPEEMSSDLVAAAKGLERLPLLIADNPPETISGLRAECRRLARRGPLGAIVVDYLQLMSGDARGRDENRTQEVSGISRGLKMLSRELDTPVVALSQLNRQLENRPDKRPHLSDLRESGCLTADTEVWCADGSRPTMGELLERGARDVPVWTVDDEHKLVVGNMTHVFPSGTKQVFALRLASGRTVRATANHPFLTVDGWTALGDLEVGSRLAVPRSIPEGAQPTVADPDEALLLGHMIGDGCHLPRHAMQYTTTDPENARAVAGAALRRFGITARVVQERNWLQAYLPAPYRLGRGRRNPVAEWLDGLGLFGKRSWEKFLPECTRTWDRASLRLLLSGLWATDGCVHVGHKTVGTYYATSSPRLARDVQALLTQLGVLSVLSLVRYSKGRDGYHVRVQGARMQLQLLRQLTLPGERGQQVADAISYLETVKANPNNDTIPKEVWAGVKQHMKEVGVSHRGLAALRGTSYGGSASMGFSPGRPLLAEVSELVGYRPGLLLAESDLYWDKVVAVEPLGEEPVFDATVEGTHNFVANGIVVHNSIEQDADAVMFLYRDAVYYPDADPSLCDLIIGKQRSGPLATIPLEFRGASTKLVDRPEGWVAPPPRLGPSRGNDPF